jgi:hypothetical protein
LDLTILNRSFIQVDDNDFYERTPYSFVKKIAFDNMKHHADLENYIHINLVDDDYMICICWDGPSTYYRIRYHIGSNHIRMRKYSKHTIIIGLLKAEKEIGHFLGTDMNVFFDVLEKFFLN